MNTRQEEHHSEDNEYGSSSQSFIIVTESRLTPLTIQQVN